METIGNIDLVPKERRVAGPGASYLMAPFTHVSTDRPSRFSNGTFGVLYAGSSLEVAFSRRFTTMPLHGAHAGTRWVDIAISGDHARCQRTAA
jgi:hypothetical protein